MGEPYVGKSALVATFADPASFPKAYSMTQGVAPNPRTVKVPDSPASVELLALDCAGQRLYRPLVARLYLDAPLVLVVYDVTSEASFAAAKTHIEEIRAGGSAAPVAAALYANKTDLVSRRRVSPKAGQALAETLGLVYFEGSARENQ